MAIKDVLKVSRKTFFNPSGWIDAEAIKNNNSAIFTVLKNLFRKDKPVREETFEQAMERMGVTEAEVNGIEVNYRTYSLIFLVCGFLVFGYSLYLLFSLHTFSGWLLATAAMALFFAQAFRYDFWAFQIKQRKLGCTFAEWKQYRLKG
ncbi:MAG: type IVB secretion system protein IcmV [Gammaproteobacteria bacterium]